MHVVISGVFDILSMIYVSVISRKLWKKTLCEPVTGVCIQLGDRPHIMYVDTDRHTISAVPLHGEDTPNSLPAAWTSIDNPQRIGISPDGGRGVVRHSTYMPGYQITTLILESGVWRRNTTYRQMSLSRYTQPITISNSGEVITRDVSIRICYE